MSAEAADRLHEALLRIVRAQRVCAWCEAEFESSDALVDHIVEQHPQNGKGGTY